MELKASSPKLGGLSPSDCVSDPEEKEISDEDDDDRNHKHRRRDTRSQSLEADALDQPLSRPFRKRNKPFENGYSYRQSDSQSSEIWKTSNNAQAGKEFPGKFEKRRSSSQGFSQLPSDVNQRFRVNQSFSGDTPGRGRGRDSRFSSVDLASQMIHQGSIPPGLFSGRGLPNAQSASWGTFGLIPGMANGGLDALHPLGLQGPLRPPINPSLNIGITRQRCRDFEERGFCLRGDMCPMEHGVNRIVIEDVQSLSQFNLPVSLPSAHALGNAAGPGALPSASAPSSTRINSKGIHVKSGRPGLAEDGFSLNSTFPGSGGEGGSDLYDPDQPLWNNDDPETSRTLLEIHSPKVHETESMFDADPDHHLGRLSESTVNDLPVRSSGTAVTSHGTSPSVWGRIGGSKNKNELKKKTDQVIAVEYPDNDAVEDQEALGTLQGGTRQRNQKVAEDMVTKALDFSSRTQTHAMRSIRRPSQKAQRTLFVNGIPQKNNRKDALLSHFIKFGEVIDIYIPLNSERAFVQFSKREEAEAALMAPDAVMGNRFIKLWWANRDNIPDDVVSGGNSVSTIPQGARATSVSPHVPTATTGKDSVQPDASKVSAVHTSATHVAVPAFDHSKPVNPSTAKAPPALYKKLENLETLKEELRKKQEMLDQKRSDFRRQLDKLQKAAGGKGDVVAEQNAKKPKLVSVTDSTKDAAVAATNTGATVAPARAELQMGKKPGETAVSQSPRTCPAMTVQEPTTLKQQNSTVSAATLSPIDNFTLDNCPTAFKIVPPLPAGFAKVSVLKEHFASYGILSSVELEESKAEAIPYNSEISKNYTALIKFETIQSAEEAFINGKCWQGHNLKFIWLTNNDHVHIEKSPSAPKVATDVCVKSLEKFDGMAIDEAASSENDENGNLERIKGSVGHREQGKELQSSSVLISCDKQSPKENIC